MSSKNKRGKYYMLVGALMVMSLYFFIYPQGDPETYTKPQRSYEDSPDGCIFPDLDPFSDIAMRFHRSLPKVVCDGVDWVTCHITHCYVNLEILDAMDNVVCLYKDIIDIDDNNYVVSDPVRVFGDGKYVLNASDHVKVSCMGYDKNGWSPIAKRWFGYKSGVRPVRLPPARAGSLNVLVLAFDSTSHHGFMRKMPESYKVIRDLGAVILEGYNIVGDATAQALFPILSGKTWMEHNSSARQRISKDVLLDPDLFIFNVLKKHGYETAFYEDMPWIGTFQYRFNGFSARPADHLLRSMTLDATAGGLTWHAGRQMRYCHGAVPMYMFMMDLTEKFMSLPSPRFCFSFITDISHNEFELISTADEDVARFLHRLRGKGLENTLLFVMGDHGSRFSPLRKYYQGSVEERMPFVSLLLPPNLLQTRPDALHHLRANAKVLTTPFDIHTTILDALGLPEHMVQFTGANARSLRGLSLLKQIPKERNCDDACILPHWCVCLNHRWYPVATGEEFYRRAADALASYVNIVTLEKRNVCEERKLIDIEWVIRHEPSRRNGSTAAARMVYYQTMVVMGPGRAVFQGSMRYDPAGDKFGVSDEEVSRISPYGKEPECVSATHPHLNKYCYCRSVFKFLNL